MLITCCSSVHDAAEILSQKTTATFVITLGSKGAMLVHKNNQMIVESIGVKSIDTTGAGDAFVGAVLYQLANYSLSTIQHLSQENWKQIIHNANKAGARTCEYMGAMEAFKHLSNKVLTS